MVTFPEKIGRMARIFFDYKRRSQTVHSMPLRLWVESASCCNLKCVMCPNKDFRADEKGLMRIELFRKIVDECCHFVGDIYLHHRGEPLLNPALFDMIRYANAAGVRTRFHSNGTLLNAEKAEQLLEAGPKMVSFSVDGFTHETYERIRVGAVFEKTVENIERFARLRKSKGLKAPYIVIEKIRFKGEQASAADVDATRRRFLDAGVDEIIEKEEYVWAQESAPECSAGPSLAACTFAWYAMVICWNGKVTPCPQDFDARMVMGDASKDSLKDIWNGEAYRTLRRRYVEDIQSLVLCRKCDRLRRKTVGGVPLQYMITFLTDHLVGYNRLRNLLGTHERN